MVLVSKHAFKALGATLRHDWRGSRVISLGLVALLGSSLLVLAYYLNHPTPEYYPDTATYLTVTGHIMTTGKLVDPVRTPGYPLLVALCFWLAGQGNLLAVSIVQGVLFVLAALEVYCITYLLTRRAFGGGRLREPSSRILGSFAASRAPAWMGLAIGLLVGTNTYLLSYSKPILSEGFSLWIVTSLALALLLFARSFQLRYFWLLVAFLFIAFMTRPEWAYAPVLLFLFLLLLALARGRFRRLAPHALAATLLLYSLLGLYIYENAALNGFSGITSIQRANLLGKVLQYDMQGEAPQPYATLAREASAYRATGAIDPYDFALLHPEVAANNWALADAYTTAIVKAHPLEFVLKTIPLLFTTSNEYFERSFIASQGPFAAPLFLLRWFSLGTLMLSQFFPYLALFWLGLLCWRWREHSPLREGMAALSFVGLYELAVISAGGYSDYSRLHVAFEPVMLVVVCASLLLGLSFLLGKLRKDALLTIRLARLWPGICWVSGALVVGGIAASALVTLLSQGTAALKHLHNWSGFDFAAAYPLLLEALLCLLAFAAYVAQRARNLQREAPPAEAAETALVVEDSPGD